jgi:hypothetical protein
MSKLIISLAAAATAVGGIAALPAPALAQAAQSEVVVYGSDPCPRETESTVVVCVHRPEQERFRLPKNQQLTGTRQQRESWASKSQQLMTVGRTGTGSCSPVGPGGTSGCVVQQIRQAQQESQEQTDQSTPPQ